MALRCKVLLLSVILFCDIDHLLTKDECAQSSCTSKDKEKTVWDKRYILYDVNPGEGFNLRRDVYMRMASMVHVLKNTPPYFNWVLVLPPWGPLYHWRFGTSIDELTKIPWKSFFDIKSLSLYVPVIELEEYITEVSEPGIDEIYTLQHYADTFKSNHWSEKYEVSKCLKKTSFRKYNDGYHGSFWGFDSLRAKRSSCLSIQGQVSTLASFLKTLDAKSIMIDRAEVILHDSFGDENYWNVRRSMKFSNNLKNAADQFRKNHFDSDDISDDTILPHDWTEQNEINRKLRGGPYLAVHLRRQDYLYARPQAVPEIFHAAKQINIVLRKFNLTKVFVATDGADEEFYELQKLIPKAIRFKPSDEEFKKYLDGGVAIIDQIICSHARYFIGTFESTFSFRIQEEREIMGFFTNSTFNSFCGGDELVCEQPLRWKIKI